MNPGGTATQQSTVVVGVDGSEASQVAITLGAREARLRGHRLRLVHVFVWPLLGVHVDPSPDGPPDGRLAADADRVLAGALAHASAVGPELPVSGEVVTGSVVPVLLAEAERSAMLVVGDRGLGGFTGLLVGSVAVQLVAHASVPVLVARGTARSEGPVVVGVDGSDTSAQAADFAFAEAAVRPADLVALHTWFGRLPEDAEQELPLIYDADDVLAEQTRRLAGWTGPARARFPGVAVHERVRAGRPARALVDASATAQLVVVGARGRGGFAGLLLGSVSQAVLHHAGCPVAIVPAAAGDPPPQR